MAKFPNQIPDIDQADASKTLKEQGHTALHNKLKDEECSLVLKWL